MEGNRAANLQDGNRPSDGVKVVRGQTLFTTPNDGSGMARATAVTI